MYLSISIYLLIYLGIGIYIYIYIHICTSRAGGDTARGWFCGLTLVVMPVEMCTSPSYVSRRTAIISQWVLEGEPTYARRQ